MAEQKIDWAIALEAVEGQRSFLAELIEIFFDEAPALMSQIDTAFDQSDAKSMHRAAHTLKGGLRYLGPSRAGELAQHLEQLARQEKLAEAAVVLPELRLALQELKPQLEAFVAETRAEESS